MTAVQVIALAANAVRAEAFNPATLFLFGSTSLAQDSLGLAVAAALQQKVTQSLSAASVAADQFQAPMACTNCAGLSVQHHTATSNTASWQLC